MILLQLAVFLDQIHDAAAPSPARLNIAMQNCTFV